MYSYSVAASGGGRGAMSCVTSYSVAASEGGRSGMSRVNS